VTHAKEKAKQPKSVTIKIKKKCLHRGVALVKTYSAALATETVAKTKIWSLIKKIVVTPRSYGAIY
jgi:hypothetical protein